MRSNVDQELMTSTGVVATGVSDGAKNPVLSLQSRLREGSDGDAASSAASDDASELQPVELTGQTGSYMYMAPEVFLWKPYFETADVFSFAIILYETISGILLRCTDIDLSSKRPTIVFAHRVALGYRPSISKHFPQELAHLITACWAPNPCNRPLFSEVVNSLKRVKMRGLLDKGCWRKQKLLQWYLSRTNRQAHSFSALSNASVVDV